MSRFIRDYELIITMADKEVIKVIPEIRVQFEVNKSIFAGLNNAKIKIYNLNADKRGKFIKDKENFKILMPFILKAGYKNKIGTIFKGNVWEAYSVKQGADYVTSITSMDGGYDFQNSFTSKTVTSNNPKFIINDMKNTKLGKFSRDNKLIRPKILVGNSAKLIEENLSEDETYYIDNGVLHILKDNEVTSNYIPFVNAETGLLGTPIKKDKEVSFSTLLNHTIKIGQMVDLESMSAKHLNGIYKVETIKYSGDNYGSDWKMDITCRAVQNYKVI